MTTDTRHRAVEAGFRRLARLVIEHRVLVVVVSLAATAVMIAGLARLRAEFSDDSYLLHSDRTLEVYEAFRAQFGRESTLLVALRPPDVFDLDFLERLRDLHEAVEQEVPHLDDVTSLVNARDTRGVEDELVVGELLEEWPRDPAELAALRERVRRNPVYRNALISSDLQWTAIVIELDTYSNASPEPAGGGLAGFEDHADAEAALLTEAEISESIAALRGLHARFVSPDIEMYVAGAEVVGDHIESIALEDSRIYTSASFVMVMVLLGLLFRRLSAILLPIAIVQLSMVSTFGLMGWLDLPFSTPTQVLITFLVAVGICDAVHILTHFYRRLDGGASRDDAIVEAMAHSGAPVVLTSLTTAGGLVSFLAAEISPVADLGIVSPVGVLLALAYTLALLPASLSLLPIGPRRHAETTLERPRDAAGPLRRILSACGAVSTRHPRTVVALAAIVAVASISGVSRARFSQDSLEWLFEDDPIRRTIEVIDGAFGGIKTLEVVVDSGQENGLYDPDLLHGMDDFVRRMEAIDQGPVRIGRTLSILDILRETNRALNENRESAYVIPNDRELIAQELLLFENSGSDDLESLVDPQLRTARLSLNVSWTDGSHYVAFLDPLRSALAAALPPYAAFEVTGGAALGAQAFSLLLSSMARSYLIALAIITPLMVLLLGDLRRGLIAMIPNLLPMWTTIALTGFLDLPINMSTLLVGSLVIGVAVDDTIHFMHGCDKEIANGADPAEAVRRTLDSTGPALLVTSLVLAGSFLIYLLGHFNGMVHFGLLASFATAVAFAADVLLAPALVVLTMGSAESRPSAPEQTDPT